MTNHIYRYRFDRAVPASEIEETLMLALIAVESLHGRARLRMDGRYRFDKKQHACEIDASTEVGADLAKIFTGYATQEYGDDAVAIKQKVTPGEKTSKCSGTARGIEKGGN